MNDKLKETLIKILKAVLLIQFFICFCTSFFISWINKTINEERVYMVKDSLSIWFVVLVASLGISYWLIKSARIIKNMDKLAALISIIMVGLSIIWVVSSKLEPKADQYYVCEAAKQISEGNYSMLEKGGYLAVYPQQLGLVSILRIIFYLFGEMNTIPFQILSALSVGIIVGYGYCIVKKISKDSQTSCLLYLVGSITCLPLYLYTSFVYGEIISVAFMTVSAYLLMEVFDNYSIKKTMLLGAFISASVFIRKNSSIFLIAVIGIIIFYTMFTSQKKKMITILFVVMIAYIFQLLVLHLLYDRYRADDADAMPAMLWIGMGTNDDTSWGGAGWFDGSNNCVFEDNDYDANKASSAAKERVKNFIKDCISNPIKGAKFYFRKITSQWCAPMYQSIVMNTNTDNDYKGVAQFVLKNDKLKIYESLMNIYQSLMYLGLIGFMINQKREIKLVNWVGLVCIFGGFLFSIIWEAKSRYIFPYFVMSLPYAAIGINNIMDYVELKIRGISNVNR